MKHDDFHKEAHKKPAFFYLILGLLFLTAGVLVILKHTGDISPELTAMIFSWPSLIMAFGVVAFFSNPRSWFFSFAVFATGFYFWYKKFYDLPMEVNSYILATVLIMIGLSFILRKFIFRPMKNRSKFSFTSSSSLNEDLVDEVNVFSGSKSEILSKNFQGGKIVNVFGGSHIDFSNADLAEGKNLIEVVCVLGGVEMIVPAHWHVVLDVKGVLGAFEIKGNRGNVEIDHSKQLFIQGIAVLGGGEVKISRY